MTRFSERSQRRLRRWLRPCAPAGVLTLAFLLAGVPWTALPATEGMQVTIEGDRMSADVGAVPIADVLAAVAEQTGAKLSVRGNLGNARPQAFTNVPMNEALCRVTQPNGVILQFDGGVGDGHRLVAIHAVAPGSLGTAPGSSSQGVRLDTRSGAQSQLWDYENPEGIPAPEKRIEVLRKLAKQRQPPLQSFTFVLAGDPDPTVRRAALGLIAGFPGAEAAARLWESVADADPELRVDALRALSAGRDKPVNFLAQVAKSDTEATVRVAAIGMLDPRDGELARAVLEGARNAPDPQVREAVEQALNRHRPPAFNSGASLSTSAGW